MNLGPRVYIAGRYRGKTAWRVRQNVHAALETALDVAKAGALPRIPHTMYHGLDGELSDEWFLAATMDMQRECVAVFLVPGWEDSAGTADEIDEAMRLEQRVFTSIVDLTEWIRSGCPR